MERCGPYAKGIFPPLKSEKVVVCLEERATAASPFSRPVRTWCPEGPCADGSNIASMVVYYTGLRQSHIETAEIARLMMIILYGLNITNRFSMMLHDGRLLGTE